jgi:Flp pilus assembly pilin Flp
MLVKSQFAANSGVKTAKLYPRRRLMKTRQGIVRRISRRSGQSLVEYALILALISVVAILVLRGIGASVNAKLKNVNGNLQ